MLWTRHVAGIQSDTSARDHDSMSTLKLKRITRLPALRFVWWCAFVAGANVQQVRARESERARRKFWNDDELSPVVRAIKTIKT